MELLVVIAIISLLTSVVLSQLGIAKQKGIDTGKIRAVAEVRNALNAYFNDSSVTGGNGTYPIGTGPAILTSRLTTKYIPSIDSNIVYYSPAGGLTYHLGIILMRSDNRALSSDADNMTGFSGYDCVSAPSGTDFCYDLTN